MIYKMENSHNANALALGLRFLTLYKKRPEFRYSLWDVVLFLLIAHYPGSTAAELKARALPQFTVNNSTINGPLSRLCDLRLIVKKKAKAETGAAKPLARYEWHISKQGKRLLAQCPPWA